MSLLSLFVAAVVIWLFCGWIAGGRTSTAAEPAAATPAPAPGSAQLTYRSSVTTTLEDLKPSSAARASHKIFVAGRESMEKKRRETKAQTENLRQKTIAREARWPARRIERDLEMMLAEQETSPAPPPALRRVAGRLVLKPVEPTKSASPAAVLKSSKKVEAAPAPSPEESKVITPPPTQKLTVHLPSSEARSSPTPPKSTRSADRSISAPFRTGKRYTKAPSLDPSILSMWVERKQMRELCSMFDEMSLEDNYTVWAKRQQMADLCSLFEKMSISDAYSHDEDEMQCEPTSLSSNAGVISQASSNGTQSDDTMETEQATNTAGNPPAFTPVAQPQSTPPQLIQGSALSQQPAGQFDVSAAAVSPFSLQSTQGSARASNGRSNNVTQLQAHRQQLANHQVPGSTDTSTTSTPTAPNASTAQTPQPAVHQTPAATNNAAGIAVSTSASGSGSSGTTNDQTNPISNSTAASVSPIPGLASTGAAGVQTAGSSSTAGPANTSSLSNQGPSHTSNTSSLFNFTANAASNQAPSHTSNTSSLFNFTANAAPNQAPSHTSNTSSPLNFTANAAANQASSHTSNTSSPFNFSANTAANQASSHTSNTAVPKAAPVGLNASGFQQGPSQPPPAGLQSGATLGSLSNTAPPSKQQGPSQPPLAGPQSSATLSSLSNTAPPSKQQGPSKAPPAGPQSGVTLSSSSNTAPPSKQGAFNKVLNPSPLHQVQTPGSDSTTAFQAVNTAGSTTTQTFTTSTADASGLSKPQNLSGATQSSGNDTSSKTSNDAANASSDDASAATQSSPTPAKKSKNTPLYDPQPGASTTTQLASHYTDELKGGHSQVTLKRATAIINKWMDATTRDVRSLIDLTKVSEGGDPNLQLWGQVFHYPLNMQKVHKIEKGATNILGWLDHMVEQGGKGPARKFIFGVHLANEAFYADLEYLLFAGKQKQVEFQIANDGFERAMLAVNDLHGTTKSM